MAKASTKKSKLSEIAANGHFVTLGCPPTERLGLLGETGMPPTELPDGPYGVESQPMPVPLEGEPVAPELEDEP